MVKDKEKLEKSRILEYPGEQKVDLKENLWKRWSTFCSEIKNENRFFIKEADFPEIIQKVLFEYFITTIKKGEVYYRARVRENKVQYGPNEMGKPPKEKCQVGGRANPAGISYLYLSTDKMTALTEIKPYVGEYVTIGTFNINKNLRIINLGKEITEENIEQYRTNIKVEGDIILSCLDVIRRLGVELSRPIRPEQAYLEYLPTQYLCELIKNRRFEGIMFNSSLGKGMNLLLFNDLKCSKTELFEITELRYILRPQSLSMGQVSAI